MKQGRAPRGGGEILAEYRAKGIGARVGFGRRPAVLVVDLLRGFTDPESPLGSVLDAEVEATAGLLDEARRRDVPAFFTVTAYDPSFADGGLFVAKIPSLRILTRGAPATEIDPRLEPERGGIVVEKQFASAFFATPLAASLTALGIDTLVVTGCTTSGCVRATVVDALQNGFRAIVPEECVGDRAAEPHAASLVDIDGKYGDVVALDDALEYLRNLAG